MKIQDYFELGCKMFGVYFLFLSVSLFIGAISTFYPIKDIPNEIEKYFTFYTLITRLLPFIYVFIGVNLIKNSRVLLKFAYGNNNENSNISKNRQKFKLFLKMLGIYLVSEYLPSLIMSVTGYLTYSKSPKIIDFLTEQQYTSQNFLPSLVAILLGVYLLRDGQYLVNLGYKIENEE